MYVLNYNGKSKKFTTIPTIKEVEDFTGNLISFGLYDSIINNKIAHGMSGTYSLVKLPTVEQLNESWESFLKEESILINAMDNGIITYTNMK